MKHLKTMTLSLALLFTSASAFAYADCYMGEVRYFPYDFAPRGYTQADGKLLSINQNQALFSLLMNKFGGDGRTNFAVPKLPALPSSGGDSVSAFVCTEGLYPPRP